VPTLLVYLDGEAKTQIVGLGALGGRGMGVDDLEWALSRVGACETEIEEDPRAARAAVTRHDKARRRFGGAGDSSDEDF
jgi:hypothetical protein